MKDKVWIAVIFILVLILAIGFAIAEAETFDVVASKTSYLPGEQLLIYGNATPGSIVTVTVYGPTGAIVAIDQVKSDPTGRFYSTPLRFPEQPTQLVPFGGYKIYVKDSMLGLEKTVTVYFTRALVEINGVVLGIDSKPMRGVSVTLITPSNVTRTVITGEDGTFSFQEAEIGQYVLRASAFGYEDQLEIIGVDYAPMRVNIVIAMNRPRLIIEGSLISIDGRPFTGYAREGDNISVYVIVNYAGNRISDANVSGSLRCAGAEDLQFSLRYDAAREGYIAEVRVPTLNIDRSCQLVVSSTYAGLSDKVEVPMMVFVGTIDIQSRLMELEKRVEELYKILDQSGRETEKILRALDETKASIDVIKESLRLYVTAGELNQTLAQIKSLSERVDALEKEIQANRRERQTDTIGLVGLSLGAVALTISVLTFIYFYRKIAI